LLSEEEVFVEVRDGTLTIDGSIINLGIALLFADELFVF
jgi:hypothetical protein